MERLQELEKDVAAQEMKLKSLHLQQQQRFPSSSGSSRCEEAMSSLIFLKEKELAHALMKVAELTGQLEHLKRTEVKSESNPRTKGKNITTSSVLRTIVPTNAVQIASEKCQMNADVNNRSNGSSKTVTLQPSSSETIKLSRSFDTSTAPKGKSTSRDQFFSSSASGIYSVTHSLPSTSYSQNGHNSKVALKSDRSNSCDLSSDMDGIGLTQNEHQDVPIKLRHSTSSSIMSRFAPKPYSNRSLSVDCGLARRPLLLGQANFQDDSKATKLTSSPVSNPGLTSKALNFCLLPKSASFHYGHSQNENSFIKLRRLQGQDGNVMSPEVSLLPIDPGSHLGGIKLPPTPKAIHSMKEFTAPKVTTKECLTEQDDVQSCPEFIPPPEPPKRRSRMAGKKPVDFVNEVPREIESAICNTSVLRDNLATTHSQKVASNDSNLPNTHQDFDCIQNVSDLSEVFKKGGVRELSKLFSQPQKDVEKNDEASKIQSVDTNEESASGKANESNSSCLALGKISEEHLAKCTGKELSLSSSGQEIDISATAVSSALSILLSGSSMSRHTTASRPNRLFGYSSSFSRPKFSFVPSDQKADPSGADKEVEINPARSESAYDNASTKAPTIYSLFSPPPKAKLLSGSPEKYPKTNDHSSSALAEVKNSTKKNVCLPRLSYITLSSNLTQQENKESEASLKKMKSKKKVTIDPSFLFLSAAVEGELDIIKSIIPQVGNPDLCNDNGMTALHMAVCNGHVEIIKFLLDYGCNVNASNYESWTPLHFAALCNKKEIAEILLSSGACVFALTASDHEIPVQKCQSKLPHYEECFKVLEDFGNQLGHINGGYVFCMADYDAECSNECSLKDGEMIRILRRGDEVESEWWWACKTCGCIITEGYVPRSVLSLHPRRPRLWKSK